MRGKEMPLGQGVLHFRITPAYAGKRLFRHPFSSLKRDHPRLCGEKIEERNPSDYVLGSPPPMRGKAPSWLGIKISDGITPAYAGKSPKMH